MKPVTPPAASSATAQPQLAHEAADRQHRHRQRRQRALGAGEDRGHLRHHVGDEEDHDDQRDHRHDGRVQHRAQQLAAQRLALFQVVGQAFQHRAQRAALLAGGDHGAVDVVELARRGGQRARKRAAGVDLAAQVRHQLALALVFGFIGQRRERAFQRQARAHQAGQLACPHGQAGGAEDTRPLKRGAVPSVLAVVTGVTPSGTRLRARSCVRAALALSASSRPVCCLPAASRASNR